MRIWIVNHYADPPDGLATRSFDLARNLTLRGHEVVIATSNFNHYRFANIRTPRPLRLWQTERIDGVSFAWIRTTPYSRNDKWRLLNMITFAALATSFFLSRRSRPDVVVGVSVHPLAALAGWLIAQVKRVPFVFEVTDLWPETLVEFGRLRRSSRTARFLYALEAFLFRRAARIITLWRDTAPYVTAATGAPRDVVWIPHTVDVGRQLAGGTTVRTDGTGSQFVVLFAGGLVQANCVDRIIAVARRLQERGRTHIVFELVGDGTDRAKLMASALDLQNVRFRPSVPKREVGQLLRSADALIYGLRDIPLYRFGISLNKLADYLAAGRPIVFFGKSSYDPVREARAGVSIPSNDPDDIADAIEALAQVPEAERRAMGERATRFLQQHHDIVVLSDRLVATLEAAIASQRDRRKAPKLPG